MYKELEKLERQMCLSPKKTDHNKDRDPEEEQSPSLTYVAYLNYPSSSTRILSRSLKQALEV